MPHVEICDAERLCTDAALVLDASTRGAAAAGSGVLDARLHEHLRVFPFSRLFCRPFLFLEYTELGKHLLAIHRRSARALRIYA